MLVRFKRRCRINGGASYAFGDVADFSDEQCSELMYGGYAEPVIVERQSEPTVVAVHQPPKRNRK